MSFGPKYLASLLVFLILLAPITGSAGAIFAPWEGQTHPRPATPGGSVEISTTGFTLPANGTITGGWLNLSTDWDQPGGNGTGWSANSESNFSSGTDIMTTSSRFDGGLSLAQVQSVGTHEDFENLENTFLDWHPAGPDSLVWAPSNLNLSGTYTMVGNDSGIFNTSWAGVIPSTPTQGSMVISTLGNPPSSVPNGTYAWLEGPQIPLPNVIRNYSAEIDHWIDLSGGGGWIEYSLDGGQWVVLNPVGGYPETLPSSSPQSVGFSSENATGWNKELFQLDLLSGIHDSEHIRFRFVIWTDTNASLTGPGWFVDNLTLSNEGEPLSCWFHGNLNGAYASNVDSWLQMNFSTLNLTTPMEITVSLDWDLEGGWNDNLIVEASNDNQSWYEISLPPGIPGVGLIVNGIVYTDETGGWVDITMPMLSIFQNRSNVWLRLRVETDSSIGYGSSLSGWEGVMVDDVVLHAHSSSGRVERTLDNFTTNDSIDIGFATGSNQQWQYLTNRGHNGPSVAEFGFESTIDLPRGWHLNHIRGDSWEFGQTNNGTGWGPPQFPNNGNGAGINLHGRYADETLTHLETKDWSVPANSSARLTFDHWVCTEANWDGGIIHISDDEGLTWSPFAQQEPNFYDALSTANPFSPLYNLMIFDGSSNQAGCNVQPWVTKEANLSAWAGETVRFRFTFFSDTYLVGAGWYIDNVGVEVDLFEPVGYWTSPAIVAGPTGYGVVSVGGEIPSNTSVSVSIIHTSGVPLNGYDGMSLPADLRSIKASIYPHIHIRVNLHTDNNLKTPILQNLHLGDNLFLTTPTLESSGWSSETTFPVIWDSVSGAYVAENTSGKLTAEVPLHRPARNVRIWCDCANVYLSVNSEANTNVAYLAKQIQQPTTSLMNGLYLRDIQVLQITVDLSSSGWIRDLYVETEYSDVAIGAQIDMKGDNVTEWSHSGVFGIDMDVDGGIQQQFYVQSGQTHSMNVGYHNYSKVYDGFMRIRIIADFDTITTISFGSWSEHYTGSNHYVIFPLHDIVSGQSISLDFSATDEVSITIEDKVVPYNHQFIQPLSEDFLSNISYGLEVNQTTGEFTVPVNLSTENGGFIIGGAITWERLITDTFLSPPPSTIYPDGQSFSLETLSSHLHETGVIDSVRLSIGTTRDVENAQVVFLASNLSTNPGIETISGSSLMSLDTSEGWYLGDSNDNRRILWDITPTREWGDQPVMWWMLESSSGNDSTLGPMTISTGGSAGPAVEVDLEVINTLVIDRFGNNVGDESNANYPWPLQSSSEISVSGYVRFQGSPNVPAPNGLADLNLSLLRSSTDQIITSDTVEIVDGNWMTNLTLPAEDDFNSGDEMRIIPSLEFSVEEVEFGVSDETLNSTYPQFLIDSQSPVLETLFTIPPGGLQPADGNVWYKENMLALSIEVSDDVRQGEVINLHYWIEGIHDADLDSEADIGEYSVLSEQLSQNSLNQVVDFPLIDVSSAIPADSEWGEVSLWISGEDLSGNSITNGGDGGLSSDLATVKITSDSPTSVENDMVSFDLIDGYLLAGHRHKFSAVIVEEQGIESLDKLVLDITGESDGDICAITWYPWSDEVTYPVNCFVGGSVFVNETQISSDNWQIDFTFILPWLNNSVFGEETWIPSFTIIDLDQDIGLGYSAMTPFAWTYNGDAEIVVVEINDLTAPQGTLVDDTIFISSNDQISVGVIAVHSGTDIPLDIGYGFQIRAEGGINTTSSTGWYAGDGEVGYASMTLLYDDYPNMISTLYVEPVLLGNITSELLHITGETYPIIFDNYAPRLTTTPNLFSVHIDRMDYLPVTFDISEAFEINPDSVYVYYAFITSDNETRYSGSTLATLSSKSGFDWNYHATLNFTPPSQQLIPQSTDSIHVWVGAADYAGNLLKGTGTDGLPIKPTFTAPIFKPTINAPITVEERIELGEQINISSSLKNQGGAHGNVTVALFIDENWVDSVLIELSPLGESNFSLQYLPQKLGIHDVVIVLNETGYSENLSVEVVLETTSVDSISATSATAAGVAMLFVFAAIIIIFRGRNVVLDEYDDTDSTDFEEE